VTVNTSASGGYLVPSSTAPAEDAALDGQLHDLVVGITGLGGAYVIPRWQPVNPKEPPAVGTDWCAIGITDTDPDENASIRHHPNGDGYDELRQQETISVLASFYGLNAAKNAKLLRDGLRVAQNREAMSAQGMALIDTGRLVQVPELINQNWRRRVDLPLRLRRMIVRTYPVDNLLEAVGTITNDSGHVETFDTANHR